MRDTEIDVVIPVYKPDEKLRRLLLQLAEQTRKPHRILLVNTERELFDDSYLEAPGNIEVIHIKKEEFDHGGTRHMAAEMLHGAFLLFLTQDAVPADSVLIENLSTAFKDERVTERRAGLQPGRTFPGWGSRRFSARMSARCTAEALMRSSEALRGGQSSTRI